MEVDALECDVLIVGGGPAGLSVAAALPDHLSSFTKTQKLSNQSEPAVGAGLPMRSG